MMDNMEYLWSMMVNDGAWWLMMVNDKMNMGVFHGIVYSIFIYIHWMVMGSYSWDAAIDMGVSSSSWRYPNSWLVYKGKSY